MTLQNFERVTPQAWLPWRKKNETRIKIQPLREQFIFGYEVSTEATPVEGPQIQLPVYCTTYPYIVSILFSGLLKYFFTDSVSFKYSLL